MTQVSNDMPGTDHPETSRFGHFMTSWPFPVVVISILISMISFFIVILLIPSGDSAASAFATDFKVWCFDYDPATGEMAWGYLYMYLVQPFIISVVIYAIWSQPLKELKREGIRQAIPYFLTGAGIVLILAMTLPYVGSSTAGSYGQNVFEPDRLRTSFMAPPFDFVDQEGQPTSLMPNDGHIAIVTGVYTSCGDTCPLIVQQIYRVMYRLNEEERSRVRVLALTLEPHVDTPAMMKAMLTAHGVDQSYFKGLTGPVDSVEPVLNAYGFAKARNEETGVLEHVNLINVIDSQGRLAFRFSLGQLQEQWLEQSIKYLAAELSESEAENQTSDG